MLHKQSFFINRKRVLKEKTLALPRPNKLSCSKILNNEQEIRSLIKGNLRQMMGVDFITRHRLSCAVSRCN